MFRQSRTTYDQDRVARWSARRSGRIDDDLRVPGKTEAAPVGSIAKFVVSRVKFVHLLAGSGGTLARQTQKRYHATFAMTDMCLVCILHMETSTLLQPAKRTHLR